MYACPRAHGSSRNLKPPNKRKPRTTLSRARCDKSSFPPSRLLQRAVFARAELVPGQRISGPAIIEQLDTTTPIYPGDVAEVTPDGHLIITIDPEASA